LRVAALPAVAASFLPRFLASFCRARPNLKVLVDGLPSRVVRDGVESGQFDIGIAAMPFQRKMLTVTPLNDRAMVALPKAHRLASRRSVHARDLDDENLILLSKFQGSLHPVEVALQSVRGSRNIETSLSTIACVLVMEGVGVAIVDPFAASDYVGRGLVLRPFEPSLTVGTAVMRSSERELSLIAQEFFDAFLEHAQSHCATLISAGRS